MRRLVPMCGTTLPARPSNGPRTWRRCDGSELVADCVCRGDHRPQLGLGHRGGHVAQTAVGTDDQPLGATTSRARRMRVAMRSSRSTSSDFTSMTPTPTSRSQRYRPISWRSPSPCGRTRGAAGRRRHRARPGTGSRSAPPRRGGHSGCRSRRAGPHVTSTPAVTTLIASIARLTCSGYPARNGSSICSTRAPAAASRDGLGDSAHRPARSSTRVVGVGVGCGPVGRTRTGR